MPHVAVDKRALCVSVLSALPNALSGTGRRLPVVVHVAALRHPGTSEAQLLRRASRGCGERRVRDIVEPATRAGDLHPRETIEIERAGEASPVDLHNAWTSRRTIAVWAGGAGSAAC